MRELVYYVAVSLDGFIAGPQDQFDVFLVDGDHMEAITGEFADAIPTDIAAQLGIAQAGERFGAVVMGANTHAVGLPQMRFAAKGYGPDRPIADNDTEEGRAKNRRIEFALVGREETPPPADPEAESGTQPGSGPDTLPSQTETRFGPQ